MLVSSVNYSYNQNFGVGTTIRKAKTPKGKLLPNDFDLPPGKWVPKNECSVPILKLTRNEQKRDDQLLDAITTLGVQLQQLEEYCISHGIPLDANNRRYVSILLEIQNKTDERTAIKMNRFAIQKKRYAETHGTGS